MTILVVGLGLAMAAGVVAHRSIGLFQSQVTTREAPIYEEGGLSPSIDLDQLWEMSDLVALATSIGSRADNRVQNFPTLEKPITLVQTRFRFQVIELFKPPSLHSSTFEIVHAGGSLAKGNEIVRHINQNFPDFESGQHYLLFLKKRPDGAYMPVGSSPDAEFHIVGNGIEPRGRSSLAKSLAQKGNGLFDELRKRAR